MSETPRVPLLDLKPQYAPLRDEIRAVIDEVVESQYFILGPKGKKLEAEIAALCGSRSAVGCASGSDALLLALMAVGVGAGDEVLCPAYTFFATAGSIWRLGAVPVFVDIDPVTFNIDVAHAREVAGRCKQLKAIMPVHLYGQACDLDACLALGTELGVPVIEDAAQAIGARDATGAAVGSRGAIGCFSFFPTKNLGGFGDGGMCTTSDETLARDMINLRNHGMDPKYYHGRVGLNSRLDEIQAAVLSVKLEHLEGWSARRGENARVYDDAFAGAGARDGRSPLAEGGFPLRTPVRPEPPATHIYNQYVIRVPASMRDGLRAYLGEHGVGSEIYYPVPLHMQACFSGLGYSEGDLPHAEQAARETIALPIYTELTNEQLGHVAQTIIAYVGATVEA